jgi:hypothetical protein
MESSRTALFIVPIDRHSQPEDIERYAAHQGCIVANIRKAHPEATVLYRGEPLPVDHDNEIWAADIILTEEET